MTTDIAKPSNIVEMMEMPLHSWFSLDYHVNVMRVPGGWIYDCYEDVGGNPTSSTFVPLPRQAMDSMGIYV